MDGKIGIYDIAEICSFHGVETAILCPGSRCAPLTLAFSRTVGMHCMSIVDERSAAFVALGIAETTNKPVVLVCTSGSAVLNFAPALAEAFYRRIPLIVLTADRPQRLVGQHDGQTMNQPNVYANFIKESFSLSGDIKSPDELAFLHRTVNAALIKSKVSAGPVHVNISFEEPLYNLSKSDSTARYISLSKSINDVKAILNDPLASYSKWLILVGSRNKSVEEDILILSLGNKVPVLCESISNVFDENVILNGNEIIRAVNQDEKIGLVPDVLVTFGNGIISKNIKTFIRSNKPKRHIHIDFQAEVIDTYQCLTDIFAVEIGKALQQISEKNIFDREYLSLWKNHSKRIGEKVETIISQSEFGDLKAIDFISKEIPANVIVHVANSMPVRYLNICASNLKQVEVFSNRGTSGIDGSISTAVGNAIGAKKQVWIISGDLSFQYDGNALWNSIFPKNLRVIIINNSGGGIFRLIDGPSSVPELTERFETRTDSTAKYKAMQHGLEYFTCDSEKSLSDSWAAFKEETGSAKILEIFTAPESNDVIFKTFQQKLSNKI